MRRAARKDENHNLIAEFFRRAGMSVADTSGAGDGFPDIVVGVGGPHYPLGGMNVMVEIKDGDKPASSRKLTKEQCKFHGDWRGPIHIVESLEDAQTLLTAIRQAGW